MQVLHYLSALWSIISKSNKHPIFFFPNNKLVLFLEVNNGNKTFFPFVSDSGHFSRVDGSSPENALKNISGFADLPSPSNMLPNNVSGFDAEGENWCSRLGVSESDFFSSGISFTSIFRNMFFGLTFNINKNLPYLI